MTQLPWFVGVNVAHAFADSGFSGVRRGRRDFIAPITVICPSTPRAIGGIAPAPGPYWIDKSLSLSGFRRQVDSVRRKSFGAILLHTPKSCPASRPGGGAARDAINSRKRLKRGADQSYARLRNLLQAARMKDTKKTLAWSLVVVALLAIIVVGATLVGVFLTQKHTEKVIQMAFLSKSGAEVQQLVMVDDREHVAAFYVTNNNVSSTIVYDYKHEVVGFRRLKGKKCFVMDMAEANVPSMNDILRGIRRFQAQNGTEENDFTYNIEEGEEAERSGLGITINVLCRDVPVYRATESKAGHLRWKFTISFNIFGVEISAKYES
ncbi:uncharacterized protein LOC128470489 [Spea bombifrons]|uniref:uncharacterized protein LOC128470489 n=1 Tax=Spea bombifrons TaxID=233779 RepID=UPI0023493714|nr:uncharacterized protein LOC128470489 [Spea bombifrons]